MHWETLHGERGSFLERVFRHRGQALIVRLWYRAEAGWPWVVEVDGVAMLSRPTCAAAKDAAVRLVAKLGCEAGAEA